MATKTGVLEEDTVIHMPECRPIEIPAGTEVRVEQGVLEFENLPYRGIKVNGDYFLLIGSSKEKVVFPNGGETPFPWLLLDF